MATNLPSCFFIQFLEQLLKFLVNFTLLKYVKSQRNYGFLITKELIFGFQILDLKDNFSASLKYSLYFVSFILSLHLYPTQVTLPTLYLPFHSFTAASIYKDSINSINSHHSARDKEMAIPGQIILLN